MTMRRHADVPVPSAEEIAKLPPDGGPEFNRLIHEKSPYLLQHARNPVDWHPWGAEALAKAKSEDKPIFLSIGYSTCHWCHVMERESFENEEVAALINKHYICIKMDREERPDIDEIYMNATQLIAGRGGWPNSVWLLPDGRPWYAGTYFPPEDSLGRPGFKTILMRLAEFWRTRRDDVEDQANKLSELMKRLSSGKHVEATGKPTRQLVDRALSELRRSFDSRDGGFGGAPKFPPHAGLTLLFYEYRRTADASLLKMATHTLDSMAHGGIRDHVGGGFHRYSTDAEWLLPHFEKMLYDNAQLSRVYVDAYLITGDEKYRRVAAETYDWVLREMSDSEGGFYSAVDADSEGEEGKFYLWSRDEVLECLGEKEGEFFSRMYTIIGEGNFRDEATGEFKGVNIPHLKRPLDDLAKQEGIALKKLRSHLARDRQKLLKRRDMRIRPLTDDKVLASWNGLMIGSLAYGGRHLSEPRYAVAAERAANFVLTSMRKEGRIQRTYREGQAKLNAYLDDYAFLADGLLDLYETTGTERYLGETKALVEMLLKHYQDEADGGFFFTSDDHENLLVRSKDPTDRAIPSGNGVAARVLVRLGRLTGEERYLETARAAFDAFLGLMQRLPLGTESLMTALAMYFDEIALRDGATAATPRKREPEAVEPDAHARKKPVTAEAFVSRVAVAPGETFHVAVRFTVDDGWHINSHEPLQDYLVPTSVDFDATLGITTGEELYPSGRKISFPFSPEPLSVYDKAFWIMVPLTAAKNAEEGPAQLTARIRFQACDDRQCLAPETLAFPVSIEINPDAVSGDIRHRSIFESIGVAPSNEK